MNKFSAPDYECKTLTIKIMVHALIVAVYVSSLKDRWLTNLAELHVHCGWAPLAWLDIICN